MFTHSLFVIWGPSLTKKNIFHRDINTSNIVVSVEGKAKLTDFGSATVLPLSRGIRGQWYYQAPEVFQGKPYTATADWFSVGVCLYEMLMSMTPMEYHCLKHNIEFFELDFIGRLVVSLTSTIDILPVLPETIKSALTQFMEKDPKLRLGNEDDALLLKDHPFFSEIKWDSLEKGVCVAPLIEEGYDLEALIAYCIHETIVVPWM